jgi:hypothetical protein
MTDVCDEKGHACVLLLTPGNVNDCKVAELCIAAMPPPAELVAEQGVCYLSTSTGAASRFADPLA